MSKIFVPQDSGHDLSQAAVFGELDVFQTGTINVFSSALAQEVAAWLEEAEIGDYLMTTGSMPVNCIAAAVLMTRFGKINMLIFDNRSRRYRAKTIYQEELNGEDEGGPGRTGAGEADPGAGRLLPDAPRPEGEA